MAVPKVAFLLFLPDGAMEHFMHKLFSAQKNRQQVSVPEDNAAYEDQPYFPVSLLYENSFKL